MKTFSLLIKDPQCIQSNEMYAKLCELLKEYNQQMLQQQQMSQQRSLNSTNNSAGDGGNLTSSPSNQMIVDEKSSASIPVYYVQLNDYFVQIRQISMQLKQRLKQCNMYNSNICPCIPSNSILDLLYVLPNLSIRSSFSKYQSL